MVTSPIYPPIIGLGRALRWSPLPLSIRDARRRAGGVRDTLAAIPPSPALCDRSRRGHRGGGREGLSVRRGSTVALRSVTSRCAAARSSP